jgi:hypothetical protein
MAEVYTRDLGGTNAWSFRRDGLETSIPISGRLRLNASEGVRAAVLGGLGFTIASQWMFAPELASGAVRAVLTEWTLPDIELWVVFPKGRMTNAKAGAFATFVERAIGRARADSNGHDRNAVPYTEIAASVRQPLRSDDRGIQLRHSPRHRWADHRPHLNRQSNDREEPDEPHTRTPSRSAA